MDQREFFDGLASKWDTLHNEDIGPQLRRVAETAELMPGQEILDVGSGTGVLLSLLLEGSAPDGRIVALDISPGMLEEARRKGFPERVGFLEADIEHSGLPPHTFDRIICNAVFPHFDDREHALKEIGRLLRSGGTLVISHPVGREAVNARHRRSEVVVTQDRVPPPADMEQLLRGAGFIDILMVDEPDFYLARARKPR